MRSRTKAILTSWLVAGTLDVSTAIIVYSFILNKIPAKRLLQSIASGIFKEQAFEEGMKMATIGLLIHYCIAFCFAITYFFLYPHLSFLKKSALISGILYGVIVWAIMNLLVLPFVFSHLSSMTFKSAAIGMSILICMIGLPIAIITDRYYRSKLVYNGL